MNGERLEEIREFLNQPDDVYEEAPAIALELLGVVDELRRSLRLLEQDMYVRLSRRKVYVCKWCKNETASPVQRPLHEASCVFAVLYAPGGEGTFGTHIEDTRGQ